MFVIYLFSFMYEGYDVGVQRPPNSTIYPLVCFMLDITLLMLRTTLVFIYYFAW